MNPMPECHDFPQHRLLLYYKGDISALTLFAQQANGSVCFPDALPALSSALEDEEVQGEKISLHPAQLLNAINRILQLDDDLLRIEAGFSERIDTLGGVITVHMARFMVLDPPTSFCKAALAGCARCPNCAAGRRRKWNCCAALT